MPSRTSGNNGSGSDERSGGSGGSGHPARATNPPSSAQASQIAQAGQAEQAEQAATVLIAKYGGEMLANLRRGAELLDLLAAIGKFQRRPWAEDADTWRLTLGQIVAQIEDADLTGDGDGDGDGGGEGDGTSAVVKEAAKEEREGERGREGANVTRDTRDAKGARGAKRTLLASGIAAAIREHVTLLLHTQMVDGTRRDVEVEPYSLRRVRGEWTLTCWNLDHAHVERIALHRILYSKGEGLHFAPRFESYIEGEEDDDGMDGGEEEGEEKP